MEDKIYVGSGTEKFDGNLVSCSLCLSDLPSEHVFEYSGKKYIKLNVQKRNKQMSMGKLILLLLILGNQSQKLSQFQLILETLIYPFNN